MIDPCAEWPKCLYRSGGTEMIWGRTVETRIVQSRDDEMEALAQGWRFHPFDCEDDEPLIAEPVKRGPGRPRKVMEL